MYEQCTVRKINRKTANNCVPTAGFQEQQWLSYIKNCIYCLPTQILHQSNQHCEKVLISSFGTILENKVHQSKTNTKDMQYNDLTAKMNCISTMKKVLSFIGTTAP